MIRIYSVLGSAGVTTLRSSALEIAQLCNDGPFEEPENLGAGDSRFDRIDRRVSRLNGPELCVDEVCHALCALAIDPSGRDTRGFVS
jgi:hypothetical protein